MKITKFKAKIVDNFTQVMQDWWSSQNDIDYSKEGNTFAVFAKRVTGKEVTISKYEYDSSIAVGEIIPKPDYFEEIDDNHPLPTNAFVRL